MMTLPAFDERDLYTGLAALHWSAYDDPTSDHDFFKRVIEQSGTPALDVGCGAGRLLRRYAAAGLDVDGVDISADMLAVCRAKCQAEGLNPTLYESPMQALDLPRRYRTIFIPCGSFVCVMDREAAIESLRRFHAHLLPGGTLVFNIYTCDYDYAQPFDPARYPTEWKFHVEKSFPETGRRLLVERRLTWQDFIEQYDAEERRYRLYEGDVLVAEELHVGQYHWYFKHELLLMLRLTGFGAVTVKGDFTDEDYGPQHTGSMVFLAKKSQ